jgi:hypothetical protein
MGRREIQSGFLMPACRKSESRRAKLGALSEFAPPARHSRHHSTGQNENVMTFTDDDLKRLKFFCINGRMIDKVPPQLVYDIEGIIARLEAAEKCLHHVEFYWPKGEAKLESDLVAWRKAAGK